MYEEPEDRSIRETLLNDTSKIMFRGSDDTTQEEVESRSGPLDHAWKLRTGVTPHVATSSHSLPPELLALIFGLIVGADPALNSHLIRVTHVCRYWRDVALHTPALWSHIALMQPAAIEAFLSRSEALPLRISVNMNAKRGSATPKIMRHQALQMLLDEVACSRILSLKIVHLPGSDDFYWVMHRIGRASSQLETLSIERRRFLLPVPNNRSFKPAHFDVPRLRSLKLIGEIPPQFLTVPNALRTLALVRPSCDVSTVLNLLERIPALEHLTLCGLPPTIARAPGKVTLARLKTVRLQGLPLRIGPALFSSLVLPSTHTNISLRDSKLYRRMFQDLVPAHSAPDALSFPALQGLKHVQLAWKNDLHTLRAYRSSDLAHSGAPALQARAAGGAFREWFLVDWPIDASHVETVDIYGNSTDSPEIRQQWMWAMMLLGVPALRTLRVRAVPHGILQAIISVLGPRTHMMPFPKLEALTVARVLEGRTPCPQLEALVLAQMPLVGESWDTLVSVAVARGPLASGGYLAKITVELPVTETAACDEPALSRLIKETGVQIVFTESK
ncbi:hypothetical protein TRAPUB_8451 [Trametes pubescens]|uniref:F-box domain-containing protein n=1 Tax=Trametes pubescens TaxID=154538 RepID=A0A1M2W574_TRAPU|nr:hypothetical protein TRAPUB_8451 [Trametes pubescens]